MTGVRKGLWRGVGAGVVVLTVWAGRGLAGAAEPAAPLAVATLNPILADIVRAVGGARVQVVEIMKPGEDPHTFAPSPDDLRRMQGAALVLASGKGLERYLGDLRGALGAAQRLVDVGATLPGLPGDRAHACGDDAHGHAACAGGEDPHWWQDVANVRRAVRIVATAMVAARPEESATFRRGQLAYAAELDELDRWIRVEAARVPAGARHLVTAHAAFGYFCAAYGFTAVPLLGLTAEQEPTPGQLREVADTIRAQGIRVVFPEVGTNPKVLANVVQETGVRVGGRLLAGSPAPEAPTYAAMMRYNVTTIVAALAAVDAAAATPAGGD